MIESYSFTGIGVKAMNVLNKQGDEREVMCYECALKSQDKPIDNLLFG